MSVAVSRPRAAEGGRPYRPLTTGSCIPLCVEIMDFMDFMDLTREVLFGRPVLRFLFSPEYRAAVPARGRYGYSKR